MDCWEKDVFCGIAGWNTLFMSVKFIWSMMSFNSKVSLFIFHLNDISIGDIKVVMPPTMIVLEVYLYF
jgi:hypothetical protein